jgi:hypothetical protein
VYSIRLYVDAIISYEALCLALSSHLLITSVAECLLGDKTDILLEWVQTKYKEFNSLFRYVRNCDYCHDFLHKGLLRTMKVLKQGFLVVKLKASLRQFECRQHELVNGCGVSLSQMTTDMFRLS